MSLPTSNQVQSVMLSRNLLFTGEAEKVRMWDLRAREVQDSLPVPLVQQQPPPANSDPPQPKHNTYRFSEKHSVGVFRMKHLDDLHWLLAGCMGLCGLAGFDLRNKKNQLYIKAHDYPILGMDARSMTMNDIAVTSGTTTNYRYEVATYSISGGNLITKYAPSHKAVITSLKMGEDMIVSGAKDGSLVALTFSNYADKVRRSSASMKIHNF